MSSQLLKVLVRTIRLKHGHLFIPNIHECALLLGLLNSLYAFLKCSVNILLGRKITGLVQNLINGPLGSSENYYNCTTVRIRIYLQEVVHTDNENMENARAMTEAMTSAQKLASVRQQTRW